MYSSVFNDFLNRAKHVEERIASAWQVVPDGGRSSKETSTTATAPNYLELPAGEVAQGVYSNTEFYIAIADKRC